jgi:hypothetical protein
MQNELKERLFKLLCEDEVSNMKQPITLVAKYENSGENIIHVSLCYKISADSNDGIIDLSNNTKDGYSIIEGQLLSVLGIFKTADPELFDEAEISISIYDLNNTDILYSKPICDVSRDLDGGLYIFAGDLTNAEIAGCLNSKN